jgi:outer membrane immunogenic protein
MWLFLQGILKAVLHATLKAVMPTLRLFFRLRPSGSRLFSGLFSSLILAVFSLPVYAYSITSDVSYMFNDISVGGANLDTRSVRLKLGFPINQTTSIEVMYASGIESDKVNNLTFEIDEIVGAYVRFHSTTRGRGTHVYLIFGQSFTTISTSGSSVFNGEEFEDFSWGIGAEEQSQAFSDLIYTLEYTRYYDDDALEITGISLGVKYEF